PKHAMKKILKFGPGASRKLPSIVLGLFLTVGVQVFGQSPSPTPDNRGLGLEGNAAAKQQSGPAKPKEAKPELVLQTGYNNLIGATRLVFSPDGRLLATGTF